jgi:FkbM family methyltransferase
MYLNIKKRLKKYPQLVKLKRKIWSGIGISKKNHPSLVHANFFPKLFSKSINFNSLSFNDGLVVGSFKSTSFLLKFRPLSYIETNVYIHGIWEPHITELISSYLSKSNGALVDIGANIGAISIPLAKHYPNSHFYLFEPHPYIFNDLKDNISYNLLKNISALNIAITNSGQSLMPFYAQKNAENSGLSAFKLNHDIDEYDVINVNCSSLDSVFINNKTHIQVIKIDTQGHELNVLLSAENLIERDRPVIIFEFESEYFTNFTEENNSKKDIINFFQKRKYDLFLIDGNSKLMPRVTLTSYFHGDIVAVPRS